MKYNIHKDKKPEDTVKKIKNILKDLEIETTEVFTQTDYSEKTSVRIVIKGTNIGTNGKGTCKINALASGYGEFIERLQSGFLIPFPEKFYIKTEKIDNFENNFYIKKEFDNASQEQKNCLRSFYLKSSVKGYVNLLEYKSIKTNDIQYIPKEIIKSFQSSNGFASGNTYEEAFVQALSEICERYEQTKILKNKICMPDVPFEYYSKYDNIINLIKFIESNGYKIRIKDASCGELPVIMTIFENQISKNKKFSISAGSHPCLSIAIERTLTEFLQGFQLENKTLTRPVIYNKYFNIAAFIYNLNISKIDIEKDNEYFDFLFNENFDYKFTPDLWENDNGSNKLFAKNLSKKVLNIYNDIYIRNYTILGQPTISLYVPKISQIYEYNDNFIKYNNYFNKILISIENRTFNNITPEDIYYSCEYLHYYYNNPMNYFKPNFHLIHITSAILLNDEYKIKKALYFAIKHSELSEEIYNTKYTNTTKYKALERYFYLKFDNKSENEINQIIVNEFGKDILNKINVFFKEITFKKVLYLIVKNYNNFIDIKEKQDKDTNEILFKIIQKLNKRYYDNPPEQEHFTDFLYE